MSETNNKWVDLGVCKYCENQTQTNINNVADGKPLTLYGCEKGIRCGKHGVCKCNSYVKKKEGKMGKIKEIDNVNHPKHYADSCSIECIDSMLVAFGAEDVAKYCVINAYKYIWRYKAKNGVEDLKKAEWYLNMFDICIEKYGIYGSYVSKGTILKGLIERARSIYEKNE